MFYAKTAEDIRQLNERISGRSVRRPAPPGRPGDRRPKSHMLDRLLIGLLSNGHVLLEVFPAS